MELCGHETRSVYDRYRIVIGDDLRKAAAKLNAATDEAAKFWATWAFRSKRPAANDLKKGGQGQNRTADTRIFSPWIGFGSPCRTWRKRMCGKGFSLVRRVAWGCREGTAGAAPIKVPIKVSVFGGRSPVDPWDSRRHHCGRARLGWSAYLILKALHGSNTRHKHARQEFLEVFGSDDKNGSFARLLDLAERACLGGAYASTEVHRVDIVYFLVPREHAR